MSRLLARLDKLESSKGNGKLCRDCIGQGFTEAPYESCDGACQQRHEVAGALIVQRAGDLVGDAPLLTDADRAWIDAIRKSVADMQQQRREAWARKRAAQ